MTSTVIAQLIDTTAAVLVFLVTVVVNMFTAPGDPASGVLADLFVAPIVDALTH